MTAAATAKPLIDGLTGMTTFASAVPGAGTAAGGGDLYGHALVPGARGLYHVNDAGTRPAANSLQTLQR
jgi:hypothetical protein